jgi:hypothetical protein
MQNKNNNTLWKSIAYEYDVRMNDNGNGYYRGR